MEEIRAKSILPDHLLEIAVARCDHTHAYLCLAVFAHAKHPIFLQHSQQSRLERDVHICDFVKKQHAAFRGTNEAFALAFRAGEGAAAMAEKLAFRQSGADCAAVDRDEGSSTPLLIETMYGSGQTLFACTGLSRDQYWEVA